jgi:hypothetical protein
VMWQCCKGCWLKVVVHRVGEVTVISNSMHMKRVLYRCKKITRDRKSTDPDEELIYGGGGMSQQCA